MKVKFRQTPEGLIIKSLKVLKPVYGIKDGSLASGFKVLRIVHDKGWFNDDDPGVSTIGWDRKCNLGTGDFNNDLFLTDHAGDVWRVPFSGKSVKLIAPRGPEFGSMRVVIDGKDCGIVRLDESSRIPQQEVFKSSRLRGKEHVIEIISLEGLAAIDAMVVK